MLKKLFIWLLLTFILFPASALAADIRAPKGAQSIAIEENERPSNVYIVGSMVTSKGAIQNDLVAAGGNVNISGSVSDDLIIAGGTVNVDSEIGENARIAGGTVNFSGRTGQDLLIAGGTVNVADNTNVRGDLLIAGGNATIDGTVDGTVRVSGGTISINGRVNGNVLAGPVNSLQIGPTAVITGRLIYSSPNQAEISSQARIGGIDFRRQEKQTPETAGALLTLTLIYQFFASLLALLALIYLLPRLSREVVELSFEKTWSSLGIGFLTLLILPIIIVALFLILIGWKLALLTGLMYGLLLITANIFSALLLGSLVFLIWRKNKYRIDWVTAIIGVLIAFLLNFIPIVGWLINFIFFTIALGAIIILIYHYIKNQREMF